MAKVVVQAGHCFRQRGATGTHREQEFTAALGRLLVRRLADHRHEVILTLADEPLPASDVFIALHTDGSSNRNRRGASVGYPDAAGARLATAWKRAHQRHGYPGGFLADNYTPALRGYYGFRKSEAPVRFLAEHGTTTNPADEAWLFSHLEECAAAHVDAVNSLYPPPPPPVADTTVGDATSRQEPSTMLGAYLPSGLAVVVVDGRLFPLETGEPDALKALGVPFRPISPDELKHLEALSRLVATGRRNVQ